MQTAAYRRILVHFAKEGDARFLSHLDLVRSMDRGLRRSGLPIHFTEGMNPKVKMSFQTALPLGMPSGVEVVEFRVDHGTSVREIVHRLAAALPEGIRPFDADVMFTGERWTVVEVLYRITAPDDLPTGEEVRELLERETIPIVRRGKKLDLRPLLGDARVGRDQQGRDRIDLRILWSGKGTARPADVLTALGRDPDRYSVVKVGMLFETSFGERIQLENEPQDPHQ